MQTATVEQLRTSLSTVIEQAADEPVHIREGEQEVAILLSPHAFDRDERDKRERIEAFQRSRDAMVAELSENLRREGITLEQFLEELLDERT